MKRKLLSCMTALAAMLAVSCSSDPGVEGPFGTGGTSGNGVDGEEVEITFSIATENLVSSTRAGENGIGGPGQWQQTIGKGQNIDMLIYAVYEKNKDDEYILLTQYGRGIVEDDYHPLFGGSAVAITEKKEGNYEGQTILNVGDKFQKVGGAEEITLRLMRGKEYHIAFWAQSSQTTAFQTNDLEAVKVIYENAKNNDELRDAFCKIESFSVTPTTQARPVILTRPMAQINVGTTGADYKNLLLAKQVFPVKAVTYSKIELKGVANTINVVTDEISSEDGIENTLVTFGWNRLAAYVNMEDGVIPQVKETVESDGSISYDYSELLEYENEEFLKIDLNDDKEIALYKTSYPTLAKDGAFLTEEFKYLSMCYALVPASTDVPENLQGYASSVLTEVNVYFASDKDKNENGVINSLYNPMTLKQVPVHRNWRTNILGGLKWMKDPTDPDPTDPDEPTPPEDPDDPTSVFGFKAVQVRLDPFYKGENSGTIGTEEGKNDPGNKGEWEYL